MAADRNPYPSPFPHVRPPPGDTPAPAIRSHSSTRPSHVRFINNTRRRVDVIWINYEGARVKYRTLEPEEFFDVTSFVTHPWIFLDSETHLRMVVRKKSVFDIPEPILVRNPSAPNQYVQTRAYVKITLPVLTLRQIAMETIQRCLRDKDDVWGLELPKGLKIEIERKMDSFDNNGPLDTDY